ncbi:MAG: hypothetical protein ACKN86_01975, partial [Crocinitomicaceae bacterium]
MQQKKTIWFVINPISGVKRKDGIPALIQSELDLSAYDYEIKYTERKGHGYQIGKEAVETLVQLMENHRDNLVIVFAGYKEEMKNFVQMNSGLKSRISYTLDFKNYDGKESLKIFEVLIKENN